MQRSSPTDDDLYQALLDAFTAAEFGLMLRVELERELSHYASERLPLTEIVATVMAAARREGWIDELVQGAARRNPGNRKLAAVAAAWQPQQPGDTHPPPRPDAAGKEGVSYAGWPQWIRLALGAIFVVALLTLAAVLWQRAQPAIAPTPSVTAPVTPEPAAACRSGVAPSPEELAAMVAIPGGAFVMGDNLHDRPQHEVRVADFRMDRFEVTNQAYKTYIQATNVDAPPGWEDSAFPPGQTAFQPVVNVTWQEAAAYCAAQGKRLPTEAEWEYACRGGGENRSWPWGDEVDPALANTLENACNQAQTVGSYSPGGDSVFGVADLGGNVSEWTASKAAPYPYADDDRNDPIDDGSPRAVRGGTFLGEQWQGTCMVRSRVPPQATVADIGFRCAADANGES